ncbi:MAG: valine--tRNA ligase [Verrucomicrobiota bacterium]|nr:valine--tRNA ligase [Verrucomicrobiota bacterium]
MRDIAIPKHFDSGSAQDRWYNYWEEKGYFKGSADSASEKYTIVIPPPNVTGVLTLGHVLNNTLQDILIRWQKMKGKEICWVPGTDHAGIATQSKVETYLKKEKNLTRYDLGREDFLEHVWEWKEKYGGRIIEQLRKLGVACDWERERFTLDDGLSDAVEDVFIKLYKKGLIYKGKRIINWCPKSRTALSDEEVIHKEEKGNLWHIKYPLANGNGELVVATTRPETMLGDTAVAVHPEDERYKDFIGKTIMLPIVKREIPVIADKFVDKEFGTGAVKVTPAHDPNDYGMGERHHLPMINVMNDDGTMNQAAGEEFNGLDRFKCRKILVEKLQKQGSLVKVEEHLHKVGYSERGNVPVEPRLSDQWFVKMKTLAEPALKVVADKKIKFYPERWTKTYNHWLENIKDWCISRQLWWGHRIPAYYCSGCGEIMVAKTQPEKCKKCHTKELHRDEDVLDTWFSSWLWPFSVFGWPHDNNDLKEFYPTNSLVTGPDIIFFWVARMIMAGLEFMDEIPFSEVYFTSIIRDEQGRKMSKSLNNSPDPLDVIDHYGADALRFSIIYIAPVGQDIKYSNEKCDIGKHFATKIWNAARFRLMQAPLSENWDSLENISTENLRDDDIWILSKLDKKVTELSDALTDFEFHKYAHDIYEFIWSEFCDWYIESAKSVFFKGSEPEKKTVFNVFDYAFSRILRLLHPIMPFLTEELYHEMGYVTEKDSIMLSPWPKVFNKKLKAQLQITDEKEKLVNNKFELISAARNIKSTYNIPNVQKTPFCIKPVDKKAEEFLCSDMSGLKTLLNAEMLTLIKDDSELDGPAPSSVSSLGSVYLPLRGVIDIEEEKKKLNKQEKELQALLKGINAKLSNENFVNRAPEKVVKREKERKIEFEEKLKRLNNMMNNL